MSSQDMAKTISKANAKREGHELGKWVRGLSPIVTTTWTATCQKCGREFVVIGNECADGIFIPCSRPTLRAADGKERRR